MKRLAVKLSTQVGNAIDMEPATGQSITVSTWPAVQSTTQAVGGSTYI